MPAFSQSAQDLLASVLSQQAFVAVLSLQALVQSVHSVVSSAAFLFEHLQELTPATRSAAHTSSSKLLRDVDFNIVQGIIKHLTYAANIAFFKTCCNKEGKIFIKNFTFCGSVAGQDCARDTKKPLTKTS